MNIFVYDPKVLSRHAFIIDATVAENEPGIGQVLILLINRSIKMKGLDHYLLCLVQCFINGVVIDEVPTFLAPSQ